MDGGEEDDAESAEVAESAEGDESDECWVLGTELGIRRRMRRRVRRQRAGALESSELGQAVGACALSAF